MATKGSDSDEDENIPEYTRDEMGVPPIRKEVRERLNPLELDQYEAWELDLLRWAFDRGRKPNYVKPKGYSKASMRSIKSRIEAFLLWAWDEYDGFTLSVDTGMLDAYWEKVLKPNDNKLDSNRRNINNVAVVLKRRGVNYEIPDSEDVYEEIAEEEASGFSDYLSKKEIPRVKNASLRLYAVPRREDMEPGEQSEWATHLAQRLRKPVEDLTEEDWERANSYKIPSLTYACADLGFRPCEVERAKVSWFHLNDGDGFLQIPKEQDSKEGKDNRRCYLSNETARLLKLWKQERLTIDMYENSDAMWLTREGNPYCADTLGDIMEKLMEEAGLDTENRETGFYMLRRGVGTRVGNSGGLSAVMTQLRINNAQTARRYVLNDEDNIRSWFEERR